MRILLSGGGTLGSVSPLIAIFEEIKKSQPDAEFLWLSTRYGRERELVASYQIPLKQIFSGKLRRYFSWQNFLAPLLVLFGFVQAFLIIIRFKPQAVLSAGGFVAVPVVWAAWVLRRPCLIHQQDVVAGLANKLMAPCAAIITVTFPKSAKAFPAKKVRVVGNLVRSELFTGSAETAKTFFDLEKDIPTVLVVGGGTGALWLNQFIARNIESLTAFCQIIHTTGGKSADRSKPRYHTYEFLIDHFKDAYAVADLVISRAGMSALTELVALHKAAIIIPMPNSHQEYNAREFARQNGAVVLDERAVHDQQLVATIKDLLDNPAERQYLSHNISSVLPVDAASKIAAMIL